MGWLGDLERRVEAPSLFITAYTADAAPLDRANPLARMACFARWTSSPKRAEGAFGAMGSPLDRSSASKATLTQWTRMKASYKRVGITVR
jgi:hypothetical protein